VEPQSNLEEAGKQRIYHETFLLTDLKPYEFNAKEHTPKQLEHIAASIREYGWTQPVVIDENNLIIIGHGRVKAAIEILKLEFGPVWQIFGWTESQKRSARIVDNKLNMDTGFNMELLEFEMEQLADVGMDLTSLGLNFDFQKEVIDPLQRAQDTDTTGDKLDTYLNNTVKQIVLLFDAEAYEKVLTEMRQIMADNTNLINNTEVFLHLLEFYTNYKKAA